MKVTMGTPQVQVVFLTDDVKYKLRGSLDDPMSEILSVTTQKDITSPTGQFSIQLAPRKDVKNEKSKQFGMTWFDKLDSFDYVEISFKGVNDTDFKVVMRGMIDTISKSENYESAIPQRTITVAGRDLGALLTDFNIYFMPELKLKESLLKNIIPLGALEFINKDGIDMVCTVDKAFDTIIKVFKKAMTVNLGVGDNPTVALKDKLKFKAQSMFPNDQTNMFYLRGYEGAYWNALARYEDKPFQELFIYDNNESSWVILRPARLHDCMAKPSKRVSALEKDKTLYPDGLTISAFDKVSINLQKSVQDVFNYFFTYPDYSFLAKISPRGVFLSPNEFKPENSENPFFQGNKNLPGYIGKFGFRKKEVTTKYVDLQVGELKKQDKLGTYEEKVLLPAFMQKGIQRNRTLVAWYLHNQYLLSGQLTIRGTNKAIIGTYLIDTDTEVLSEQQEGKSSGYKYAYEYYIEGVSHNFILFQSFTTQLRLSRGLPTQGLAKVNKYTFGDNSVYAPVTWKVPAQKQLTQAEKIAVIVKEGY